MNARWLVLPLLLVAATTAEAQCRRTWWGRECRNEHRGGGWPPSPVEFGVRGGYDFDDESGLAGAQLRVPLVSGLALVPSADVWLDEAPTDWQINTDLTFGHRSLGGIYLGGGAAFVHADPDGDTSEDTEVGFNAIVGMGGGTLLGSRVRPFAEGRWTILDDDTGFRLTMGIDVPIT